MKPPPTTPNLNLNIPSEAETFIRSSFANEPKRLAHILQVAKRVQQSAEEIVANHAVEDFDIDEAHCAALLHDVGYLQKLHRTGFHPWDGYYFLKEQGLDRLADIIVCHSNSPEQAKLRGLPEIPVSDTLAAKLLTYWDTRVMQGGRVVTYEQRLSDIKARYGEEGIVTQSHLAAEPRIKKLIAEIEEFLGGGLG